MMQAVVTYTIAYAALMAFAPSYFLREDGMGPKRFGWEEEDTPAPLWLAALAFTIAFLARARFGRLWQRGF